MEIPLSNGGVAIIDACDYCLVKDYNWWRHDNGRMSYATAGFRLGPRVKNVSMHRTILALTDFKVKVDHRNHNGLDNRRINLRPVTNALNVANSRMPLTNTSGYKGVCFDPHDRHHGRPWRATMKINCKLVLCSYFASPVEAARAYDAAALYHFGQFACINFPYQPV